MIFAALMMTATLGASHGPAIERAYRALEEWQLPAARAISEELMAADPKDAEVIALASRVQFYRGEYESAASLYAYAVERGAEPDRSYASVLMATREVAKNNLEAVSPHFRISYPPGKDAIFVDYAVPVLEAAYQRIARDLGLTPDPGDKVAVLVVPDAEGLAAVSTLLPQEIENSGTIAICKFNRLMVTSPLATYTGYDWADTLAHEYVHLVINLITKSRVPIWLHEGIAKFTETRWDGEAGRALSSGSIALLAKAAKNNAFIPFEKMHPSMAKLPTQEDSGLAFAEVFVAIAMLQEKRGLEAIKDVLAKIGAGSEIEAAVSAVYGKPFSQFLKDWKEHLKAYKGKSSVGAVVSKIELKKKGDVTGAADALEPIAEKRVHDFARLGELLHLRGRTKAAAVEYEKAYAVAGTRYPSLVNKYATALVDTGAVDKAEALLKALVKPYPNYTPARLMLARLALKRGQGAEASEHFYAAIYQNPFNPEIFAGLLKAKPNAPQSEKDATQRHLQWALGKDLPGAPAPLEGEAKLTILAAPFGRARLANGRMVAYPAALVRVPESVQEVELIARDGRTKTLKIEKAGQRYEAKGTI